MSESESKTRTVAWQGWRLVIPRRWDAVKLEGDHSTGYALFADSVRPRLGIRWQTPPKPKWFGKPFRPIEAIKNAMRAEVGQLAADEAKPVESLCPGSILYVEPDPPGRDVFSGFSPISNRLVQLSYHAHRREHLLASYVLPTLEDLPVDRACPWSIFDLSLVVPGGMHLESHRLNAGDLGLTFADRRASFTVRQIAVASLALQRMNLDGWIAEHQKAYRKHYSAAGGNADLLLKVCGRSFDGRVAKLRRKRRYLLAAHIRPELVTLAAHDCDRDRLLILHGTESGLLEVIAETVGREERIEMEARKMTASGIGRRVGKGHDPET